MKKNLEFVIIIANYNGQKYLTKCFESLEKTKYKHFKVCVVDDGSTDLSLEIVKKFQKNLNIDLLIQTHAGASKARNKAIRKYENNSDVIVFLDNDTEVAENWLDELNLKFEEIPEASGFQCLLIDFLNRDKIQSNGVFLIPHVCWGVSYQAGEDLKRLDQRNTPCAAISAALAIKSEVLKKVGYFDEKLAVSTEDLDFTWRLWIYGFKIFNCPSSAVYHYSKNIENRKEMNVNLYSQYFHITKNSIRSLFKNYSFLYLIYYLPLAIGVNLIRALLVLLKRKDSSSLKAFFNAVYWNLCEIKDTLKNRKVIQQRRRNTDNYLYNNVMIKDSLPKIYEKNFKQTNLL